MSEFNMTFVAVVLCLSVLQFGWTVTVALSSSDAGPCGEPLFLTRYITEGRLIAARNASKVRSIIEGEVIESYSGFLTVNSKYNSNLFFWFFPAENRPTEASTALWLQGGPGWSSMYGLLTENGPISVTKDLKLKRRSHYWSQELNMIYIDSPVGAGFSFTDDDDGYATDEAKVGKDLHEALVQFFELFPEFQNTQFFITGESYAGKYIPALAHTIHENNPRAAVKINLVGFAIGNGWIDPKNMMGYSEYLYQHGLIDDNTRTAMEEIEQKTVKFINENNFLSASVENDKILTLMTNISGPISDYNYLIAGADSAATSDIEGFFSNPRNRRHLHVGNLTYSLKNGEVHSFLFDDITKSVAPWLEQLMDHYRVLLYNGQLDIIVAYPLTIRFVRKLKWNGAQDYQKAPRKQWYVGDDLAGYVKTVRNFTEILVRNSGHMVAADQPVWALDLITRFTKNIPFDQPTNSENLLIP